MEITDIFSDEQFKSLNALVRWNGVERIKHETVAHHSFLVSMFGTIIVETMADKNRVRDRETYMELLEWKNNLKDYFLFHDFDEMFSGDLLNPFKYNEHSGDDIRRALSLFIDKSAKEKFKEGTSFDIFMLEILTKDIDENIKIIVKLCDWMSCVFYIQNEIKLGNKNLESYLVKCFVGLAQTSLAAKQIYDSQYSYFTNTEILQKIHDFANKSLTEITRTHENSY